MKNLLILIGFCLGLLSFTSPETCIEGKVIDKISGNPLIGCGISVLKDNKVVAGVISDVDGNYKICNLKAGKYEIIASYVGYNDEKVITTIVENKTTKLDIKFETAIILDEIAVVGYRPKTKHINSAVSNDNRSNDGSRPYVRGSRSDETVYFIDGIRQNGAIPSNEIKSTVPNSESYGKIVENKFHDPREQALSTFSIDVDRASYSNVRRFINNNTMPPSDAVRIEEIINYFPYNYDGPKGDEPLKINTTYTDCPWNVESKLLHIGLQSKKIDTDKLPSSNIVFLVDVSGSMQDHNKLPLVQASLKLLLNQLKKSDNISIVTYAGRAAVLLDSAPGDDKKNIEAAIDALTAGGSTAGAEGILTAYKLAEKNFIKDGNNRVVLATDGDFNVGINDNESLEKLIEKKRSTGIFLSVLGYGMGNYKDDKMQILADKGNGNHAYIDNILEAKKTLVYEFSSTIYTLAKDVKIQVEFNPQHVKAYKLIGYENRLLNKEDFNDDTKDAGEMGSGHTVTAIYEIVPTGTTNTSYDVDDLKYQKQNISNSSNELATVKFRYKNPDGDKSMKLDHVVNTNSTKLGKCDDDIKFSIAVAQFGRILRNLEDKKNYASCISLAKSSLGDDAFGFRSEFLKLVESAELLSGGMVKEGE